MGYSVRMRILRDERLSVGMLVQSSMQYNYLYSLSVIVQETTGLWYNTCLYENMVVTHSPLSTYTYALLFKYNNIISTVLFSLFNHRYIHL